MQSGVVFLHAPGRTTISAFCLDWKPDETGDGAMADLPPAAYIDMIVEDASAGIFMLQFPAASSSLFDLSGRRLMAPPSRGIYIDNGVLRLR